MATATIERSDPKYRLKQKVRTDVVSGEVVEIAHGGDRGWASNGWYYSVATGHHPKPHWVREKEIVSAGRKPA